MLLHETYLSLQNISPENTVRRNYLLAACSLFNESKNFDFEIAMKLIPCGGVVGMDSSLMDIAMKLRPCGGVVGMDNSSMDIAMKLRSCEGVVGIDNSSTDRFLKESKILRLHAVLKLLPWGVVVGLDN